MWYLVVRIDPYGHVQVTSIDLLWNVRSIRIF